MGHAVYCAYVVEHCNMTNELKDKQTFGPDHQDEEVLMCTHRRLTFDSRFTECVHFYAWVHECIGTVMYQPTDFLFIL